MSIPLEHDYIGLSETMEKSNKSGSLNLKATELRLGLPGCESPERDCGLAKTSLSVKRGFSDAICEKWVFSHGSNGGAESESDHQTALRDAVPPESPKPALHQKKISAPPASKAQVVGWPPIRASRKNMMTSSSSQSEKEKEKEKSCIYVKVSMDGAPYLRKVDLNTYTAYSDLSAALEKMFTCFTIGQCGSNGGGVSGLSKSTLMDLLHGSEFVLTYEDKDGDWMLVGDVPWKMFTESCKRLRIMKSSDAIGLAPRAMEKCKNRN